MVQFATNHLAHFLLTQLLLPVLVASSTPTLPSRVVCLSSAGHAMSPTSCSVTTIRRESCRRPSALDRLRPEQDCEHLFWQRTEVQRPARFGPSKGVNAAAVHPGFIATPLAKFMKRPCRSRRAQLAILGFSPAD